MSWSIEMFYFIYGFHISVMRNMLSELLPLERFLVHSAAAVSFAWVHAEYSSYHFVKGIPYIRELNISIFMETRRDPSCVTSRRRRRPTDAALIASVSSDRTSS